MSELSAFQPSGNTVLVGATALQVPPAQTGGSQSSYRVRCLIAAYLTWGGASVAAAGAPTAGSSVVNTMGFAAGQVEVFKLSPGIFFISSVAAAFEVTPGEGL